ncbi:NrfD/PsrC family molybdoenzyme membrane anchor subunit [Pseudonocardia spinosispora]|uniref:NrfD/PsrC family molybdoenzyme membrane anchor subunit n=1 Tax=Pseudonocardia spinosispora TaxID=103441 RepID=UPI000411BB89|nr:NrfD/PsrC family molybdoenzyme membrane anchor subunit [Pseudonocardia spinosispora]
MTTPRRTGRREPAMVPDVEFRSYYGRPIVKASPWQADIPAYLFLGGLAGASSLLAAGADLTGNAALRRPSRITALAAILASFVALVHDLGKPSRFHHMLRVAKATSPMSVGTWILTVYGPLAGLAAASEAGALLPRRLADGVVGRLLPPVGRGAGLIASVLGPAVASYTAVLLADTATPAWHSARDELPFVFVGSAAAAAGGMGMLCAPVASARPARRLAVAGAVFELAVHSRMESTMGLVAEPLHQGRAGGYTKAARTLTATGAVLAAAAGGRSRTASAIAGVALLAGSAATRFGIFYAGQQSADDPRYTILPQRT